MKGSPAALARLTTWLTAQGFEVDAHEESLSFGEFYEDFSRGVVSIRVDRDRDGNWLVRIRALPDETWYDVAVWQAYLDGSDAPLAKSVVEMVDFVTRRLPEVERASWSDSTLTRRLAFTARELTLRTLGFPDRPPNQPP